MMPETPPEAAGRSWIGFEAEHARLLEGFEKPSDLRAVVATDVQNGGGGRVDAASQKVSGDVGIGDLRLAAKKMIGALEEFLDARHAIERIDCSPHLHPRLEFDTTIGPTLNE